MVTSNGRYVRFEPLAPYLAYLNQESWRASSRPNTPHSPLPGEWPRILEQNDLLVGAMIHDAGVPLGYHPLSLARYEVLRDLVPHNTAAFAGLFAMNYARTSSEDPPPVAAGQFLRVVRQSAPTPAYLWRRTDPFPPLREGVTVRAAADVQEAAALIADGAANGSLLRQVVVVAEDLVHVPALQEGPQITPGAQLSWDGPHRGRIRLAARPAAPVVLPLALPYAPGWQARDLAGNPLPVIPADLAATAIVLPQGNTGATLHYSPYSFRLGLFVMLLSLGLVLVVAGRRIAPGE
jgi:hypothetical protein